MEQNVSQTGSSVTFNINVTGQEAKIEGNNGINGRERKGGEQDQVIPPKASTHSNGEMADPPLFPPETGNLTQKKKIEKIVEIVTAAVAAAVEMEIPDPLPTTIEFIETAGKKIVEYVGEAQRILTLKYTGDDRLTHIETFHLKDFRPGLAHEERLLKNQHDIFNGTLRGTQPRRIVVSGNKLARNTAFAHSISYNWAVQDPSSRSLMKKQLCFELSMKEIKQNQTLAEAIKEQLFSDLDKFQAVHFQAMLKKMPEQIVILFHEYDSFETLAYTGDILEIIQGKALAEATVLVTAQPRAADLLENAYKYRHIKML